MRTYTVTMIDTRRNFRRLIAVHGYSCADACAAAKKALGPEGYTRIESIRCIG